VIGGVKALWFAPQSGKQLQTLVHKQGKALKHQADEATSHVYEQIEDTAAQAAEQVEPLRQDGEQLLNDRVEMINQAALSVKKSMFK
jgi:gas vesicle protein